MKYLNLYLKTWAFFSILSLVGESPYPIWVRILIAAGFSAALIFIGIKIVKSKWYQP